MQVIHPRLSFGKHTQTCQGIDTINVHRTASTNALSTTPPERKRGVNLILDPNECIQHHRPGLVQVQGIRLHLRLARRLIRVPPIYLKCLDLRILARTGLLDVAGLARWLWSSRRGGDFGGGTDGFTLGVLDCRGHSAAEGKGRQAPSCEAESHGGCVVWWQWQSKDVKCRA